MTIDRESVDRWLADYVAAWKSYDPDEIGALFSADVAYRFHPYDEPFVGRESVVAAWLNESLDPGLDRDAPDTYDATYRAVAVEGGTAVAVGSSTYLEAPGGAVLKVFENCFLIRFDAEGRCREFTEWFMERPKP